MRAPRCRNFVLVLLAAAAFSTGSITAAEAPAPVPPKPPRPEGNRPAPPPYGGKRGAGAAMWAAFARLSDAERRELMELQRTDPEKFREVLRRKAEEYWAARIKRHEELRALAAKIRQSQDPAEREMLRKRLTAEVKTDFLNRLAEHRRRIEEMKAHAAKLEKALDQRTAEVDQTVEKAVQAMIEGREPERPPRKGPPPPRPPQAPRDR